MIRKIQLEKLAYARSGDKGDICDIGLLAFSPEIYQVLRKKITPEVVKAYFGDMVRGKVLVYEIPNLDSLEIVMYGALGGGAPKTLRWDLTGKSMGQALLRMFIELEDSEAEKVLKSIPAQVTGRPTCSC